LVVGQNSRKGEKGGEQERDSNAGEGGAIAKEMKDNRLMEWSGWWKGGPRDCRVITGKLICGGVAQPDLSC